MAMLAEPRRRQKWSLNPRGSAWANDDNKIGQKLMEKMGWSKGKGLGREEQGEKEHISVKMKDDVKGLGYKSKDDEWIKHYEGFESVLATLNSENNSTANSKANSSCNSAANSDEDTNQTDERSLETRSKVSRARVHYHKFTRGKDMSRYKEDDIACILGSKRAKKLAETKVVEPTTEVDEIGHIERMNGVTTIKGCNIQDYFAQKLISVKKKAESKPQKVETQSYLEREEEEAIVRPGFGFGFNTENGENAPDRLEKKVNGSIEITKKKKKGHVAEVEKNEQNSKKKKQKRYVEAEYNVPSETKTFESLNGLQESVESKKKKKKHKKKDKEIEFNENHKSLDSHLAEFCTESKESKKIKKGLIDEGLTFSDSKLTESEYIIEPYPKKKKKRGKAEMLTDELYVNNDDECNLECTEQSMNQENKKKKKRKRNKEHNECNDGKCLDQKKSGERKDNYLGENGIGEICQEDKNSLQLDVQKMKKKKLKKHKKQKK